MTNYEPTAKAFIEFVDQKIEAMTRNIDELRKMREVVAEVCQVSNGSKIAVEKVIGYQVTTKAAEQKEPTRKQQVAGVLKEKGPLERKDILAAIPIPIGTLAYVLNDKKLFKQLKDGRWDLKGD